MTEKKTRAELIADTVASHYTAAETSTEDTEITEYPRDDKGRFLIGMPSPSREKGIMGYIRSKTKNGQTLIDLLYDVAQGREVHGKKPTLRDSVDAVKDLLDRGFGKPTQQIQHSSDETAKSLLAIRQQALKIQIEQSIDRPRDNVTSSQSQPVSNLRLTQLQPDSSLSMSAGERVDDEVK